MLFDSRWRRHLTLAPPGSNQRPPPPPPLVARRSPWKTYVDPHAKMLCYHHLQTQERVFDFEMTHAKLREINELNIVAEVGFVASSCGMLRQRGTWPSPRLSFAP